MDGPAGRPADNPPNSDRLGVYHRTVPESTVSVYLPPGPPISQRLGLDPDPDPKRRSWTVANTSLHDILIYTHSEEEHDEHVKLVMQRHLEAGLYQKPERCEFHK